MKREISWFSSILGSVDGAEKYTEVKHAWKTQGDGEMPVDGENWEIKYLNGSIGRVEGGHRRTNLEGARKGFVDIKSQRNKLWNFSVQIKKNDRTTNVEVESEILRTYRW